MPYFASPTYDMLTTYNMGFLLLFYSLVCVTDRSRGVGSVIHGSSKVRRLGSGSFLVEGVSLRLICSPWTQLQLHYFTYHFET